MIVGGGISGAYAALRLGEKYKTQVCLFETRATEGGCLMDVKTNPWSRHTRYIGVGARRVIASQTAVVDLAKELNINLQNTNLEEEFLFARSKYGFVTKNEGYNNFSRLYPTISFKIASKDQLTTQLYKRILNSSERDNILSHPNLRSYILSVIGDVGLKYLKEMTRFKGDFEISRSASSYIDYIDADFNLDYDNDLYPVGGMSEFPKKMLMRAMQKGAQIFRSEPILSIEKISPAYFMMHSKNFVIQAENIILAIPPHELN